MGQRRQNANASDVALGAVALRAALVRIRNLDSTCRECGIAHAASVDNFHINQLKVFLARGEPSGSMVCLSCAKNAKVDESRPPIGLRLDVRTGCPQRCATGVWKHCTSYRNYDLQFPYDNVPHESAQDASSPCDCVGPSVWVTDCSALDDMTGFRYFPNFLTQDEEKQILAILDADEGVRWQKVFRRRQQFYGEVYYHTPHDEVAVQPVFGPHVSETVGTTAFPMNCFAFLIEKFYHSFWRGSCGDGTDQGYVFGQDHGKFPTQILVNEYLNDFGISSHFEDEDAFGSVIATISLLAPLYMQLEKPREHTNQCSGDLSGTWVPCGTCNKCRELLGCTKVLLEPRSLFVMSDACRFDWRHGITRQSVLPVPRSDRTVSSELTASQAGCAADVATSMQMPMVNADDVPMDIVRRDARYRRISLTIRHLLPGRKQVVRESHGEDQRSNDD